MLSVQLHSSRVQALVSNVRQLKFTNNHPQGSIISSVSTAADFQATTNRKDGGVRSAALKSKKHSDQDHCTQNKQRTSQHQSVFVCRSKNILTKLFCKCILFKTFTKTCVLAFVLFLEFPLFHSYNRL